MTWKPSGENFSLTRKKGNNTEIGNLVSFGYQERMILPFHQQKRSRRGKQALSGARGDRWQENGACGGECSGDLRAFQEDISNPHKTDSLTLSSSFFQLGPITTYEEVWTPTKPLKEFLISGAWYRHIKTQTTCIRKTPDCISCIQL